MGIVETDQACPFRPVQGERIAQAVWALGRRIDLLDFELHEIPLGEMMFAAIEGQKIFKRVFRSRIAHMLT